MNWLEKISKRIETRNIPWQIAAAINAILGKGEWSTSGARRDWNAARRDRAVLNTFIKGTNIQDSLISTSRNATVRVIYTLPFNDDPRNPTQYESTIGLSSIEFQPSITITEPKHWIVGPIVDTPVEVAQWVVDVINGDWTEDSDGFNNGDNNDNNDKPPTPVTTPELVLSH